MYPNFVRYKYCFVVSLLGLHGYVVPAHALFWENQLSIGLSYEKSDNVFLTETNKAESSITRFNLNAEAVGSTERSALVLSLSASAADDAEDTVDEQDVYQFSAQYSRQDERYRDSVELTLSELNTADAALLESGALVDSKRSLASISPGFSYSVTESDQVSAGITFTTVSYDTPNLVDYNQNDLFTGWNRRISEIYDFGTTLTFSSYTPDGGDDTETVGIFLNNQWRLSENSGLGFDVGSERFESPDDSETTIAYNLSYTYSPTVRDTIELELSNAYRGDGSGSVNERRSISFDWQRNLTEATILGITLSADDNDSAETSVAELSLTQSLSQQLALSGTATRITRHRDQEDGEATELVLSLNYIF